MLARLRQRIIDAARGFIGPQPPASVTTVAQAPAMSLGEAPITISLAQVDELRAQVRQAHARVHELEIELANAKRTDPSGRIHDLEVLASSMMSIVRFAIANLPPSEIANWPVDAIRSMAHYLKALPTFGEDDRVFANELNLFAKDIAEHETARARRRTGV